MISCHCQKARVAGLANTSLNPLKQSASGSIAAEPNNAFQRPGGSANEQHLLAKICCVSDQGLAFMSGGLFRNERRVPHISLGLAEVGFHDLKPCVRKANSSESFFNPCPATPARGVPLKFLDAPTGLF